MTIRDHLKRFLCSPVISPTLNLNKHRHVAEPRTYNAFLDSPIFDQPIKYTHLRSFFTPTQELFVGDDVEIEYRPEADARRQKHQRRVGIGRIMGLLTRDMAIL